MKILHFLFGVFNCGHPKYLTFILIYRFFCCSAGVPHLRARCPVRHMMEWDRQGAQRQDRSQKDHREHDDLGCHEVPWRYSVAWRMQQSSSMGKGATKRRSIQGGDIWAEPEGWEEASGEQVGSSEAEEHTARSRIGEEAGMVGGRSEGASGLHWGGRGRWGQDSVGLFGCGWRFAFSF